MGLTVGLGKPEQIMQILQREEVMRVNYIKTVG